MKKFQQGLTLIELMITLSILAIITSMAVPSFSNMIINQEIDGAAEKIYQDLLFARSEAVKQNKNIHLSVNTEDSWCYGFTNAGVACNCGTTNSCMFTYLDDITVEKAVSHSHYKNISLSIAGTLSLNGSNFDPSRGTLERNDVAMTDGAITISRGSTSATIKINTLGRPSICSNTLSKFSNC